MKRAFITEKSNKMNKKYCLNESKICETIIVQREILVIEILLYEHIEVEDWHEVCFHVVH